MMKDLVYVFHDIIKTTLSFYGCLIYFLRGKSFRNCPYFKQTEKTVQNDEKLSLLHAKIHVYSIAAAFYMYDKPIYRKSSYKADIIDNFRNVSIPGTGLPLSWFVSTKISAYLLVTCVNPVICMIAAIHYWLLKRANEESSMRMISDEYFIRLLTPNDWFSYWRLNSRVAAYHAYLNHTPAGYDMENKWTFLQDGKRQNIPVSPFLENPAGLVVKHKNEEGGLGIHFYENAVQGGDWIIQERIHNSDWVANCLPSNAPLSTFRIMTFSNYSLDCTQQLPSTYDHDSSNKISTLSCVFRAGRQGASTDHDSILFNVDTDTGTILHGTTNAHWYQLGIPSKSWRSHGQEYTHHPDGNITVTGKKIPCMQQMKQLVEESHFKMCPFVPFVGWDVVLSSSKDCPICLLEVNLSCNFFRGSFDKQIYLEFLSMLCTKLHSLRDDFDTDKND